MTTFLSSPPFDPPADLDRRRALTGILEYAVASLELTAEQRDSVESTYKECGIHLAKALGLSSDRGDIFPQGSMRLGTVIRPLRHVTDVFDLDVVFRIVRLCTGNRPDHLRTAVGEHLRTKYNGAVKPLAKGWRLDFSRDRDYYLDVIPAMDSERGGNVIAITDDAMWRDSNPRDYALWFERHAAVLPRFEGNFAAFNEKRAIANSARIEPLPDHTEFKSPLQRIVQIAKRHRDYYFNRKTNQSSLVTPSIVLTTLLTKAYARAVHDRVFNTGFDLLLACVEDMSNYIEVIPTATGPVFRVENPSLPSENLVEKWKDRRYAQAFFTWQKDFDSLLRELLSHKAPQRQLLTEALGARAVNAAFAKQAETINAARQHQILGIGPTAGLTIGGITSVPRHVIHGIK
jgi:hypothetical protein